MGVTDHNLKDFDELIPVVAPICSCGRRLPPGALAVLAPRPAAGSALALFQLLLGPANAAFSGLLLLGILNPANELVAGQGRDVLPCIESRRVGDQRLAQVSRKLVHHPTGDSRVAHRITVAGQGASDQLAGLASALFPAAFRPRSPDDRESRKAL